MNVLMVLSSQATLGEGGGPTGAWLEELAGAYWVFVDAGCRVTLASPRGGAAPIDPLSLEAPWLTPAGERFRGDPVAMEALAGTRVLTALRAEDFAAVFLVGGVATAWDYPHDPQLARIVSALHAAGRPVSGVCHGVLGLTGAHDAAGNSLFAGREATAVSNAEEELTGFDAIVPVMPENRLRELGARYRCSPPFEACVVSDGLLLTGQNPASAAPLAQALLERARTVAR
jgi:putative intracellular protease/amidase